MPRDQKWLLLLSKTYPRFLREGRQWRSHVARPQTCRRGSDSGLSDSSSNSESEEETDIEVCAAHLVGIDFNKKHTEFDSELPVNMVEIRHLPQELQITMGSDTLGDVEREEVISDAVFNYFGAHFAQKYLGPAGAAALSATIT